MRGRSEIRVRSVCLIFSARLFDWQHPSLWFGECEVPKKDICSRADGLAFINLTEWLYPGLWFGECEVPKKDTHSSSACLPPR